MVARLMGFLRPPENWHDTLTVCTSYSRTTLKIAGILFANVSANKEECQSFKWPDSIESSRVAVDFESHKPITFGQQEISKMELQHFKEKEKPKEVKYIEIKIEK